MGVLGDRQALVALLPLADAAVNVAELGAPHATEAYLQKAKNKIKIK